MEKRSTKWTMINAMVIDMRMLQVRLRKITIWLVDIRQLVDQKVNSLSKVNLGKNNCTLMHHACDESYSEMQWENGSKWQTKLWMDDQPSIKSM